MMRSSFFVPLLCVVLPGNCCTVGIFWMSLLASCLVFSLSVLPHSACICLFKIVSLSLMPEEMFCCSQAVVFAFHSKVGRGVKIACASGVQFYFKAKLIY